MSEQSKPKESPQTQPPAQKEKIAPGVPDKFRVERMICNDSAENLAKFREKGK